MATNDWKAELRRRIDAVNQKKEENRKLEKSSPSYQTGATAPAEIKQPQPKRTDFTDPAINHATPLQNAHLDMSSPEQAADEIFQVESKPEANEAVVKNKIDIASAAEPGGSVEQKSEKLSPQEIIRSALAAKDKLVEELSSQEQVNVKTEEQTLFPMEAEVNAVEPEQTDRIDPAPHNDVTVEPENKTAAPSGLYTEEAQDRYQPLDDFQNEALPSEDTGELVGPLVLDKTHQHTNFLRIGASLVDGAILLTMETTIILVSAMLLNSDPISLLLKSLLPFAGLFLALHFIYFTLFTSSTGQTPGKSIFGLKVVSSGQGVIGFGRAIARWLLMLLALIPAAIGFLYMFVENKGRTIYDVLLGQRIVRTTSNNS